MGGELNTYFTGPKYMLLLCIYIKTISVYALVHTICVMCAAFKRNVINV